MLLIVSAIGIFLLLLILERLILRLKGQNVVVTGGSSGLGKAIAKQLLSESCKVTIVARRQEVLDEAMKELKAISKDITTISADVTDHKSAEQMIDKAAELQGSTIDGLFCCAGAAEPGFFVEQEPTVFERGMRLNYLGAVNCAQRLLDKEQGGHVVFVSSTLGLMGMVGYSQYCPTKFAVRGLAESLRQELKPHNIDVSVYFVSTIESPGLSKENETKPEITKLLEGSEGSDGSPEARARTLIDGIKRGQFSISSDFLTELFRVSSQGASPRDSIILNSILNLVANIALPIWSRYADFLVWSHQRKEKKNK